MKKLLVWILVLGLAPAANALTLSLTVNGVDVGADYSMIVGETVWIGVYSDGVADAAHYNGMYNVALVINPAGTETGTGVWTGDCRVYLPWCDGPIILGIWPPPCVSVSPQVCSLTASSPNLDDPLPAGIGADFLFHCTGPLPDGGDVTILLIDTVTGPADTLTIHQSAVADIDFGDAPEPSYPTTLASNGARHIINPAVYLGQQIDAESNGQPTPDANGDDADKLDDEDGVLFTTEIVRGEAADVNVTASSAGLLDAWLDFNADGDWADPGEQIFVNFPLNVGGNIITFNVPSGAKLGNTYARFRFSSEGNLSYDGQAADGEVEDYKVFTEGCFPSCHRDYGIWLSLGQPECWCFPIQCHGDADRTAYGYGGWGWYFVGTPDLGILADAWMVKEPPFASVEYPNGISDVPNGICADFDHKKYGSMYTGYYRVGTPDLGILAQYWMIKEPPGGPGVPPDCLDCP